MLYEFDVVVKKIYHPEKKDTIFVPLKAVPDLIFHKRFVNQPLPKIVAIYKFVRQVGAGSWFEYEFIGVDIK
jgi:hypothetical protein